MQLFAHLLSSYLQEMEDFFSALPWGRLGWGHYLTFFTANGGFLILFLFSLPSGGRGGGWRRISESMLSGISATTR